MKELSYYIAMAPMFAGAVLGIYLLVYNRVDNRIKPLIWAILVSFTEDALARYSAHLFRNNQTVFYLFDPLEYAAFAWFFFVNIDYPIIKQIIKTTILLFSGAVICYLYFFLKHNSLTKAVILDYEIVVKEALLTVWAISYIINLFDRINNLKKLNIAFLLAVVSILLYSCFGILLALSEVYLVNYSSSHHIPITEMFSPANNNMYASRQYHALSPFHQSMVFLLYLCVFVALLKSANFSKKQPLA